MKTRFLLIAVLAALLLAGCTPREKYDNLQQLAEKEFAVPNGTIADQLVLTKFPNATFKYFNTVLDCSMAVKTGKADAVAYDEPLLRNIAANIPGLKVLPDMITIDHYGFAVRLGEDVLKQGIDEVLDEINANGYYDGMMKRWLPEEGKPAPMPEIALEDSDDVLVFGTSATTEPFSFVTDGQNIVGIDIEIAKLVAKHMNKKLDIVNMDFSALIPALAAGKVDMIGACITISEERKQKVLFSKPYYTGGIAALVQE